MSQAIEEWRITFKSSQVQKGWQGLLESAKESMERCEERLRTKPMERVPGRVFPLKGKPYKGAWEYEVTGADRVFYIPNSESKTVLVYYAGAHPKPPAPYPPKL